MAAFIITSIKNILTFMKFLKLFNQKKKKKTVGLFHLKICRMHSYLNNSLFINFTVSLITYVSPSSLSPALTALCISLSLSLSPHTHTQWLWCYHHNFLLAASFVYYYIHPQIL